MSVGIGVDMNLLARRDTLQCDVAVAGGLDKIKFVGCVTGCCADAEEFRDPSLSTMAIG